MTANDSLSQKPHSKIPWPGLPQTCILGGLAVTGILTLVGIRFFHRLDPSVIWNPLPAAIVYRVPEVGATDHIEVKEHQEISLSKIPRIVQEAFLSVHDHRFFERNTLNPKSIVRMIYLDLNNSGPDCYDPSILANMAHNALAIYSKSVPHRLEEQILALKLERRYSKEEILQLYLNRVYFGRGVFGVEGASRYYFGKSVSRFQIHEVALLVALSDNRLDSGIMLRTAEMRDPDVAMQRRTMVPG